MLRTTFTATEKLDIILGLKKTDLTKSAYFRACGIPRSTFVRWQNFYMQDGLEGLKELVQPMYNAFSSGINDK
ncbi:helix-turn-helix domain-containing protein [Lactiplantibacillus plantarum]|uniref:helix-turn-helix domain-containing protein n=1 Tax=Lactiplantibacillus plantarum TaxID=1590 RepID=UPI00201111E0|nr:helix-turn-helix domain-containing protein [Lactiplantibacillus plantarum]